MSFERPPPVTSLSSIFDHIRANPYPQAQTCLKILPLLLLVVWLYVTQRISCPSRSSSNPIPQTAPEIIAKLSERGCNNLTSHLNLLTCSQYPVSTGGFADVYSCRLHDNTKVAIKVIRPCDTDSLPAGKYEKVLTLLSYWVSLSDMK